MKNILPTTATNATAAADTIHAKLLGLLFILLLDESDTGSASSFEVVSSIDEVGLDGAPLDPLLLLGLSLGVLELLLSIDILLSFLADLVVLSPDTFLAFASFVLLLLVSVLLLLQLLLPIQVGISEMDGADDSDGC